MKNYVLTGASSGIGRSLKAMLLAEGNNVIDVSIADSDIMCDLTTDEGREYAISEIHRLFPEGLDGLVCCAGVPGTCPDFKLIMSLNFYGAVAIAEGCFDLLQMKKGSCVLTSTFSIAEGYNIPDIAVLANMDDSEAQVRDIVGAMDNKDVGVGSTVYITSKYALTLWMRRHAVMWGAKRVRLNCVAPGTTNTPMVAGMDDVSKYMLNSLQIPIKYKESLMLEPEEVANVMKFLLSPESSAIHGSLLFADGGTECGINTERVY